MQQRECVGGPNGALGHRARRLARLMLLVLLPVSTAWAATQYLYDDLGRLVLVANTDGSATVYTHDANGNVLSINQWSASGPVVAGFSPTYGHVGTPVTILGTGFSATPTANTVTIGGATAAVTSATATTIETSIPFGATTGPIAVTVAGATGLSTQNITVYYPLISSFSPPLVAPGAAVTITGGNLNLVPGSTSMTVGGTAATITSLTNGQAVITAPSGTTGGPIVVNTSYGQATSGSSLVIVPAWVGVANVVGHSAIEAGGAAQSLSISQQNKKVLFSFHATAGQFVSLQFDSLSIQPSTNQINYAVLSPSGASVMSGGISAVTRTLHLPKIATTGQHLVWFDSGTSTSVQIAVRVEVDATLTDGETVSAATSVPRQAKRFVFDATAGDDLSFGLTGLSLSPASPNFVRVYVTYPDGNYVYSDCSTTSASGCSPYPNIYSLVNLPLTGSYTIRVEPQGASTMSFDLMMSQDVAGTLTPGTPLAVSLAQPGRQALLTFDATSNQTVAVNVGSIATTPPGKLVTVKVFRPNGSYLTSVATATQTTLNLTNLAAGTHSVQIAPADAAMASLQATLANGLTATLPTDGSTQTFSSTVPQQHGYFTFSANAGDDLGLALTALSITPSSPNYVRVWVNQPNGYSYTSFYCNVTSTPGCSASLVNLPLTGIYTVVVESMGPSTMSFNLTLSQDTTGALSAGTPLGVSLNQPGRQALLTFAATAGQTVALNVDSIATTPSGKSVAVTVYQPNGNQLSGMTATTQKTLNLTNLAAGTYTVLIAPADAATASLQATLANGLTATLPTDGSTQSFSSTVPQQHGYFTFAATAGDDLGLALTGLSITPSSPNYVRVWVNQPNGYSYTSFYCNVTSTPGCSASLFNLPLTGTYAVVVESLGLSTMSFNLTLSQDVTGTLTPNTPLGVTLGLPGRQALLTFDATAGQTMALNVGSIATTPTGKSVTVTVYRANGTQVAGATTTTQSTLNLTNLSAGTHSVLIAPADAATATVQATLANGLTGPLPTDGSTLSVASGVPLQHAYFTFSAAAGDDLGIALTGLSITPSSPNYVRVWINRPDGYNHMSFYCYTTNVPGCAASLLNLPLTGTYAAVVESLGYSTMSFGVTLSQDQIGALTLGTPFNVDLSVPGKHSLTSFTTTAVQTVALSLSSISTTPAGKPISIYVYNASGSYVAGTTTSTTLNLTNLAAGTYYVLLQQPEAATGTAQLLAQ